MKFLERNVIFLFLSRCAFNVENGVQEGHSFTWRWVSLFELWHCILSLCFKHLRDIIGSRLFVSTFQIYSPVIVTLDTQNQQNHIHTQQNIWSCRQRTILCTQDKNHPQRNRHSQSGLEKGQAQWKLSKHWSNLKPLRTGSHQTI